MQGEAFWLPLTEILQYLDAKYRDHGKRTLLLPQNDSLLVFAGSVLWTEKIHRTELNRTVVRSIFWLWLPKFGVILVAGCLISKIIQNRSKTG